MREIMVLSAEDVRGLIDVRSVIEAVEGAFREYAEGKARMPAKTYLDLPEYGGDFRAMPALTAGFAGIKWVNVHPRNPERGLPTVMATIILNDPATGEPLACMDGTVITNYRTGAAAAVASKYLAKASAKNLGLVGLGEQAKTQLLCIAELFPLEEVKVFDTNEGAVEKFLRQFAGFNLTRCHGVREAVAADIVSTTTPVTSPIVKREWVKEGTHINAMGADAKGKEELDPDLLRGENVRIIVDDMEQAIHSGEVNVPISHNLLDERKISGTLPEVVAGRGKGREKDEEITIFDSTGLAIQDIAVAKVVYERAKERGQGSVCRLL